MKEMRERKREREKERKREREKERKRERKKERKKERERERKRVGVSITIEVMTPKLQGAPPPNPSQNGMISLSFICDSKKTNINNLRFHKEYCAYTNKIRSSARFHHSRL
jgi:hypothetical protein